MDNELVGQMIGTTISHYKILEKLGEGGMGVVYKAEDTKLERTVALKFLPQQTLGGEEEKARFMREAKAAAALAHPSICHTYEIDEVEGQTFIAMEHIEGKNLSNKIEAGPLDVHEAINITLRVAEGLKHAHKRGIVHRDIKPANIMIAEDGQVKIMDFGLAKLTGKTRLTKTATIMGTVAYMSPEQAHGDKDIGKQADIWSLGVMLYEMLSGKLPFDAETDTGLIYKIVHEDPEPIRNHRSDIPGSLVSLVEKAMQKDPQIRHEGAEELIADLEAAKSEVSVSAKSSSPSIAVLPFVNMSADPEQEYFCDGLAEELINALTQIKDLHVVARTSAFFFKDKDANIRDIGKELNVKTVLEGSVRKAGERVRITAQLVNVDTGYHLWSERYDREMEDIFDIQDDISQAIVDKLKPALLRDEKAKLGRRQTVNLMAYNLYLRGRWFADRRTAGSLEKAIEHFEKAVEEQPNYAYAYAGLADCYSLLSMFGPFPPKEVFPKAREAALRALEIDNTLAEAHTSLGMCKDYHDWDWEGAEREYRRAIELNPGYATAHHQYGMHLGRTGCFAEAIKEIERALELDPLSLIINNQMGMVYYFAGEYEKAEVSYKKTLEMDPSFLGARFYLGLIYARKHMYEEAVELMDRGEKVAGEWETARLMVAGYAYALTGKRDKAEKVLRGLLERSEHEYVPPVYLAIFHFFLGEVNDGFTLLDKAYDERDTWVCFLKVHPSLDFLNLRSDPRYLALLKKIGLDD